MAVASGTAERRDYKVSALRLVHSTYYVVNIVYIDYVTAMNRGREERKVR